MSVNKKDLKKKSGLLQTISELIIKTAKKNKVQPYEVTSAQFWSTAGNTVSEWEIRKLGGFTGIRSLEFPAPVGSAGPCAWRTHTRPWPRCPSPP
jgi:hypothetical protein